MVSGSTYATVMQAIIDKDSIAADYDGHHREMSPHVIGIKRGSQQALFYQYAGTSKSGPLSPIGSPDNWRCVMIGRLQNVRVIKGVFHTAPKHTQRQTCVYAIDMEIAY